MKSGEPEQINFNDIRSNLINREEINELNSLGYKYVEGLDPIVFNDSKILVLGSLPGAKSVERKSYYSNRGNKFWSTLS